MLIRPLSALVSVSGQIEVTDIPEIAAAGFAVLVNHRPDGEETRQPTTEALEHAALAHGLTLIAAPVRGLPEATAVEITARALADLSEDRQALLFCRSGMRSAAAWAMAERLNGASSESLRAAAASAGFDLSQLPL